MGRHTGPRCKLCRAENAKLYLKGEKCYGPKCPFNKRAYLPGQHGQTQRRKVTEFGLRLREKQKARRIYGLSERQFRSYFERAALSKSSTGEKLLELLERRLDNTVWRSTLSPSRDSSRQLVRNGHVLVNGKKVTIPSYIVNQNDVITVKEKSREFIKNALEKSKDRSTPAWLSFDPEKIEAKVVMIPKREEIDAIIDERLIVEFYSR